MSADYRAGHSDFGRYTECMECGYREMHLPTMTEEQLDAAFEAFGNTHKCPQREEVLPTVQVETDGKGVTERVKVNGHVIPDALVDVDLHLGRVTLIFQAKLVIL